MGKGWQRACKFYQETGVFVLKFTVDIPFKPVSKARPRLAKDRVYTPSKTKTFEHLVGTITRAKMSENRVKQFKGAVYILVKFVFKTTNKGILDCANHTTPNDIDNLLKALFDGLNKVAFVDDKQISQVVAYKMWGESDMVSFTISDEPFVLDRG